MKQIIQKNQKFRLFASCVPVKGYLRSSICDLQRSAFYLVPNEICEIFTIHRDKTIDEINYFYNNEFDETIEEYFAFLLEKELLFFTDEPSDFPDLSLEWDMPNQVTNAILDIDENSNYDFQSFFENLELLGCKAIQIRCFCSMDLAKLENVLKHTQNSRIRTIELVLPKQPTVKQEELASFLSNHKRVYSVTFYNSEQENYSLLEGKYSTFHIFDVKEVINSSSHCGNIHPAYFSTNISTFTESQAHNTCLNRKISIDVNGEIKNCPSMLKSYGNIKDTTLSEALEKRGFKDLWYVHKDQIKVCKDCEFRHICTDCRAYIQDPKDIFSKPAKCSYDPYTAIWGEENPTNNPLYQQ